MKASEVLRELETYCEEHEAGTTVPSHTEWMARLGASERAVLTALTELQRQGKIVRRRGARTLVADKLGVVPVSAAVQTQTIVAIATPDHSFFDHAVETLFSLVEEKELSLVCRPFEPGKRDFSAGEIPLGYILFRGTLLPLARRLQAAGHRVVLVGTPAAGEVCDVPNVRGDQEKGGYLIARHLIELGHTRIAFRGDGTFAELLDSPRGQGYGRAIREATKAGKQIETSFITNSQFDGWKKDIKAAQSFWSGRAVPTAVAVWNDFEALSFIGFLSYIGVSVPGQVSVIGYDNLPGSASSLPTLSTVDGALEHLLQAALDLLLSPEPTPQQKVVVLPTLIARHSTAPALSVA